MALSPSTMSNIDLDDLIATLNTQHIGSEQLDLANLQAQLQQALQTHAQATPFPTSPIQIAYSHPGGAPTNTPTARTPSWGQFADASHTRRRRSSSAASTRTLSKSVIREEDEMYWRHGDGSRLDMEQDGMEDVQEEAEVDASLFGSTSPSYPAQSPQFGSSPNTYASTDPFLAAQLQAAEQRNRQPSFFAQVATAQQHTSPFYSIAQQGQQAQSASMFPAPTPQGYFVPNSQAQARPVPLKIDTACMR